MFEILASIVRLPFGLFWIFILFITWPLGLSLRLVLYAGAIIWTPFKFIICAVAGNKSDWNSWTRDWLNGEDFVKGLVYPIMMIPGVFSWIRTGK